MLDPAHPITAFFDDDPAKVLASLSAIEKSSGAVHSLDTLSRKMGERELHGHRNGLFDPHIFGGAGTFGHIETAGVVHPSVVRQLVEVLNIDTSYIDKIVRGEMVLRDGKAMTEELGSLDGDISGPRAIAEAVKQARPDFELLPLCCITKIPVPPLAARPTRMGSEKEAVDPWLGPLNEAWLQVIERAYRDSRLIELDAPPIILHNEATLLQRAFEEVYQRTRRAEARLVPGMLGGDDEIIFAIAFAGPERIVIQRGTGIRIVDISGREVAKAAPSGCHLRGVVDGHLAVFQGISDLEHHPMFNAEEQAHLWPADFLANPTNVLGEISVLDVNTREYLVHAPESVPRTFVENDQPEDLFFGERKLHVGGDRPAAAAYTNDLRFAWIAGDTTEIIALTNGLTVARPATTYPDEIEQSLDLRTGEVVEHEWFDEGGGGASAIAFADGRWFTFDHYGVLCDHVGNEPIVIVPRASAAAFDPSGKLLAIVIDPTSQIESDESEREVAEDVHRKPTELVIIDRATRAIVSRFVV